MVLVFSPTHIPKKKMGSFSAESFSFGLLTSSYYDGFETFCNFVTTNLPKCSDHNRNQEFAKKKKKFRFSSVKGFRFHAIETSMFSGSR
jgi:hypothetical protein